MRDQITDKYFIRYYDNLILPEDCDRAIEFFKRQDEFNKTLTRSETEGSSIVEKSDTSTEITPHNFKEAFVNDKCLDRLFLNLNNVLKKYLKETKILEYCGVDELHWQPQKIQKTLPSGGYHLWHIERCGSFQTLKRVLVYTIYLNDVDEGGETEFLIQNMRIKPKKGRVCFFPAHFPYLHRGNPPLSGEKYIMTSWFVDDAIK